MIELDVELKRPGFKLHAKCRLDAPVTGLLGSSGAGKSTLLGIIAGYIKPDRGSVMLDGIPLYDSQQQICLPLHTRRIGMVFQDSRLFPHLNVRDNLHYGLKLRPRTQERLQYEDIVELLELGHLQAQRAHQLSGGEKQRVALGRALLAAPRLLLLDEPLASLDLHLKNQILPFLRRVKDELAMPMLYVSHSINEVLYLTNQVALMEQGRLLGCGNFHQVMKDESMLALAHSLGLENVVRGTVSAHDAQHGYSTLMMGRQALHMPLVDTPEGEEISVSIAAASIALSRQKVEGITIQNQLPGKVSSIQIASGRALVEMEVQGQKLLAEITPKALHDLALRNGLPIYCLIKTQSVTPLATDNK